MFCPKCGSSLTIGARGNFECPSGLEFSVNFSRELREHYPHAEPTGGVVRQMDGARRWFCSGCGDETTGTDGPCDCGIRMTPVMVHSLIELHPHPNGRGGWF